MKKKFNSKNFKYEFISILVFTIISLTSIFAFSFNSYNNLAQIQKEDNFVADPFTDYRIYGMNNSQKEEYNNLDSVEGIASYTYYNVDVNYNNLNHKNERLVILESFDTLEYTPYRDSRLIEKSKNPYDVNVYIGYTYAKTNGLKIGTEIQIPIVNNKINGNVSAIYEDNMIDGVNTFAISYVENKSILDTNVKDLRFLHNYLRVNNPNEFEEYYKNNYKPLGIKKELDDFKNSFEYNIYLKDFNEKNYYEKSYINQYSLKHESNIIELRNEVNKNILFIIIISSLLIILFGVLFGYLYNKNIKNISLFTSKIGRYINPHIITLVFSLILVVLSNILVPYIFININNSYVSYALFIKSITPLIISNIVSLLVIIGINSFITYETLKKKSLNNGKKVILNKEGK